MDSTLFNGIQKWQDLLGAVVGGLMGVVGAMIVAGNAVRREQRTAARLLIIDLSTFGAMSRQIWAERNAQNIPEEHYPLFLYNCLQYRKATTSPLYDSYLSQLMDKDNRLAAHLVGFKKHFELIDFYLGRTAQVFSEVLNAAPIAELRDLARAFEKTKQHATVSQYLLAPLQLSFLARAKLKLRRHFYPTDDDKFARNILHEYEDVELFPKT